MVAERERLRGVLLPGSPSWPRQFGVAVLQADDGLARHDGFVCVGDSIRWTALDAVFDLALYGYLAHRHLAHGRNLTSAGCAMCDAGQHFNVTPLVDPIMARRGVEYTPPRPEAVEVTP
ncbi:hypothetical protein SAMN05892883_4280 [Jatrophihabitans sp. GAS493]|nr:hypothetical protein SAMN05892883_4280 [Jatrophihabitans sp. GAS493]